MEELLQHQQKVKVIGVAPDGECLKSDEILKADIIAGGRRILNFFKSFKGEKVILDKKIRDKLQNLKKLKDKKIVILASGDPLFFGIGKLIIEIFGRDNVEFIPYLNSVQLLCSKFKINYEDFINVSVHGREISNKIIGKIKYNKRIAVLLDKYNNINKLSEILLNYLDKNTEIILGQMLGTENERIVLTNLKSLKNIEPSELDTILIFNKKPFKPISGIDDNEFYYEKGLITKREIRTIAISQLDLEKNSVVWDIGAGSGAVSIEASTFSYLGNIYAIEKEKKRIELIKKNIEKFKCHNISIINGSAPECLKDIEKPDRVFIGGTKDLNNLLNFLYENTNSIIVANFVTIEKLNLFINFCKDKNLNFDIFSVHVANLNEIGNNHYFKSQNTVYICKTKLVR